MCCYNGLIVCMYLMCASCDLQDSSTSSRSVLCVHDVFVCKYEAATTMQQARRETDEGVGGGEAEAGSSAVPQRLLPLHLDQVSGSAPLPPCCC
jgi:hypothetical protein